MKNLKEYILTTKYDVLSRQMKKDKVLYDYVRRETCFLAEDASNSQRFYHLKNDFSEIPKCLQCGKETEFSKKSGANRGYNKFCNHSCKITFLNLNRSEKEKKQRKEKIKQTCLEKYGVESHFASKEVRDKITNTFLNKYGVDNPSKVDSIKRKKENTCLKNYGVKNPSHSPTIHAKKSKTTKNKLFITETGKTFHFEGYEDRAIKTLLGDYHEDDILVHSEIEKEIGKIRYAWNEKQSIYHPDIYIKSQHKIIEVKSTYWYNRDLERNLKKKDACIASGLNFEFWVYKKCSSYPQILS